GFVEAGNTVVVIEHNLDVVKTADWVIDLGPEGGSGGGEVVCTGTPADVAECEQSYTGQALRTGPLSLVPRPSSFVKRRSKDKGKRKKEKEKTPRRPGGGAEKNILKNITVPRPGGELWVWGGPGGWGRSSLALDTIYAGGRRGYIESLSSSARQF